MNTYKFQCSFCDKKYKQEHAFNEHVCDQMRRSAEIKTLVGQRAYGYYVIWNTVRKYPPPTERTFIESGQYNAFILFAKFIKKVRLPNPEEYVKVMVEKTFPPHMWINNLAYKHYLDYMDRRMCPLKQMEITVDTIFERCEEYGVDTSEFFNTIDPNEFIQYIMRRQLSPWFFLNSDRYIDYYNNMDVIQRNIIDGIQSQDLWEKRFIANKKHYKKILGIIDELGL